MVKHLNIVATVFTITRRIITLKLQVSSSLSASILQKIVCLCSQHKNMIRALLSHLNGHDNCDCSFQPSACSFSISPLKPDVKGKEDDSSQTPEKCMKNTRKRHDNFFI